MNNFRPITHLETLAVLTGIPSRKEPLIGFDAIKQWKSANNLLLRAKRAVLADPLAKAAAVSDEILDAEVRTLEPESAEIWHINRIPGRVAFVVPLITNPACWVYSGTEMVHMEVGSLWWVNTAVLHSEINAGLHDRIHLVFEMRRAEQ